ncbi:MAG: DegT/DnrJ/EryC1/StrS family aminotransferase [Candidatus Hodarchaeota archaeon]
MEKDTFIKISGPSFGNEEIKAISDVIRSGWWAEGPKTEEFEKQVARYIGTKYAVATSSGSTALHTLIKALKIGSGDEVIMPSFTFIATPNATLYEGAKPIFVDIDQETYNIAIDAILEAISKRTKAIIPVHWAGLCCNMQPILEIAEDHNLLVVEDAAQAIGSMYYQQKAGSFGDGGVFSFYASKNLTVGEGGMIVTNSKDIAVRSRIIKNQGQQGSFNHVLLGYNYRTSDIASAIGLVQLTKLEDQLKHKILLLENLTRFLSKISELKPPFVPKGYWHTYMHYTVYSRYNSFLRDKIVSFLNKKKIQSRIYIPPCHLQPFYKKLFGYKKGMLPITEEVYTRIFNLPCSANLTMENINRIKNALTEVFKS